MEHLGYEPNRVARSLRGSSTRTVAIGVHDLTSSFHTEILRGAEDVLNDLGYSVLMGNSAADQARAKRNLEAFLGQRVDGTILTTFVVGIEREVALLGEEVNGARPAPTGPTGPTTRSHRGEKPPIS
jgi:LacI family transcriptional regulator